MKISVIVPVLNEETLVGTFLEYVDAEDDVHEIVVVDGGSRDSTFSVASSAAARSDRIRVLQDPEVRGRARQMNHGSLAASGDVLAFVHVDCRPPKGFGTAIRASLGHRQIIGGGFLKMYDQEDPILKLYRMINNILRARIMKNFVGTNVLFVRRDVFLDIGMYPDVPILEDVLLCDRLKKAGRLAVLRKHVVCSSRRYRALGTLRHVFLAARVLFLFRCFRVNLQRLKETYVHG